MPRRRLALGLALLASAAGLSACGRAADDSAETHSQVLTVYASLPLQGPRAAESESAADGERLALSEAGGHVGSLTVKLVVQDDSTAASRGWDGEQSADNARTAVRDKTAIAYLGDSDSAATAISLPILNEAGIAQISPLSTYAGLTRPDGADKGEPDRFYPLTTRTFARVIPADQVQARAQLDLMARNDCDRVAVLDDRDLYGRGLSTLIQADAMLAKSPVIAHTDSLRDDADPGTVAKQVVGSTPNCVFLGADETQEATKLLEAMHTADPDLLLFVPDSLSSAGALAPLDPGTQAQLRLTLPQPQPTHLPAAAEDFAKAYQQAFDTAPLSSAYYGYEAMKLALLAIDDARSQGNNRTAVVHALLRIRDRDSILGRYSLDRYGDTTIDRYGEAVIRNGQLHVQRVIVAAAPGR